MVNGFFGGIDNLDRPIHRFIRLPHFRQLVQGELVLARPTSWDDPYELLTQRAMITDKRSSPWQQYALTDVMANVFGQSWSLNEDSDTYLRAYSSVRKDSTGRNKDSDFESVRITTTPRKLQGVVERAVTSIRYPGTAYVFTCAVKYVDGKSIESAVISAATRNALTALERAKITVDLCCLKRPSFRDEREVRSLVMFSDTEPAGGLLTMRVEPSEFIDAICFDPRLASGERIERVGELKGSTLEGRVVDNEQYQGILLNIVID